MEEAVKFLRHTLPGLVFSLQLVIIIAICCPTFIECKEDYLTAGSAIAFLFISGALGYVFSFIYYFLYWWSPLKWFFKLQHFDIVKKNPDYFNDEEADKLSDEWSIENEKKAWAILLSYWFSDKTLIKMDKLKFESLSHITHSIGTTTTGMFIGFITAIPMLIIASAIFNTNSIVFLIINLFVILIACSHYRRTLKMVFELHHHAIKRALVIRSLQQGTNHPN